MALIIPENYVPKLSIRETEGAIKCIKDFFEKALAKNLSLLRISAPLFVFPETGLNDNLNGVERPVSFEVLGIGNRVVEVVHSLAKWKRSALKKYNYSDGEGIYTDMNAIRRDEELDNLHSIYVDQWDWEKIIQEQERNRETLYAAVTEIFEAIKETESYIASQYPKLAKFLPQKPFFVSSQELLDLYPNLSSKEREDAITKKYGAVFIWQIGNILSNGEKHDGRAADYDDWQLNGDLLLWYPVLNRAMEITSMGIRVDENSLLAQLKMQNSLDKLNLQYHKAVINKELPYTIGGGIGQSRLCLYLLNKAHIGEVQAAIWSEEMIEACEKMGIYLL